MKKFKVIYQETRWYAEVVEADDEDDAREVADSLMTSNSNWNYRDEGYVIIELENGKEYQENTSVFRKA